MNSFKAPEKDSLILAPMEGITNEAYRQTVQKLYPQWNYLTTDFLRVPTQGKFPDKHLIKHMGKNVYEDITLRNKTIFQILTSFTSQTSSLIEQVSRLEIPWLDLNLGCPSNTVCGNKGGSFLLTNIPQLRLLIRDIRQRYGGFFSVKIRIGFHNADDFDHLIEMFNEEKVNLITVHARTRDDMYKNPARWNYIKRAVEISSIPIIGNGDVWSVHDIDAMKNETNCYGVMVARGGLKSPWIAHDHYYGINKRDDLEIIQLIQNFFQTYYEKMSETKISPIGLLKQSKSLSRFIFDDLKNGLNLRQQLLTTQDLKIFYSKLLSLNLSIE